MMPFKFESLEVWQRALEYIDLIYAIAEQLPVSEQFNLRSQITRAATSVALNIAEGSTTQSDPEQARFLAIAIRSLIETVACLEIIRRRNIAPADDLDTAYSYAEILLRKLQAFRRVISGRRATVQEDSEIYLVAEATAE
jgi:four helix bundle protein